MVAEKNHRHLTCHGYSELAIIEISTKKGFSQSQVQTGFFSKSRFFFNFCIFVFFLKNRFFSNVSKIPMQSFLLCIGSVLGQFVEKLVL